MATETISRFPLQWPAGWPRVPAHMRKGSHFQKKRRPLSVSDGIIRLLSELQRLGVSDDDVVISSMLRTRLDGFPLSSQAEPSDSGVAVYWRAGQVTRCMATDRYDRVADNLAALAATLEAMRAIERHGGADILDRAFTGFTALPSNAESWWGVLGVAHDATWPQILQAYKHARSAAHPDNGGSDDRFHLVYRALADAQAARGVP